MPLAVDRYELGPLQTNCYVVRSERGAAECAVIDPGGDAADLRLELHQLGRRIDLPAPFDSLLAEAERDLGA